MKHDGLSLSLEFRQLLAMVVVAQAGCLCIPFKFKKKLRSIWNCFQSNAPLMDEGTARHAKRTNILPDDVKLCTRRNEFLVS